MCEVQRQQNVEKQIKEKVDKCCGIEVTFCGQTKMGPIKGDFKKYIEKLGSLRKL